MQLEGNTNIYFLMKIFWIEYTESFQNSEDEESCSFYQFQITSPEKILFPTNKITRITESSYLNLCANWPLEKVNDWKKCDVLAIT